MICQELKHAIHEKKSEVFNIEECIQHVKCALHQIRATVAPSSHNIIAGTFQDTSCIDLDAHSVNIATPEAEETTDQHFEILPDFSQGTSPFCEQYPDSIADMQQGLVLSSCEPSQNRDPIIQDNQTAQQHNVVQRTLVVGNTSKYLLNRMNCDNSDNATHKWMVYVTGQPGEADISDYVESVWFLLDPSYKPNDQVHVTSPPFQLVRRGWGEFPIRIRVHFHNPLNKAVDILHHLVLDVTKSGRQMFGSEKEVTITIFEGIQTAKTIEIAHATDVDLALISEPARCKKGQILQTFAVNHDHCYCSSSAPISADASRVLSPSASYRDAYLTNLATSYPAIVDRLLQKLVEQVPIVSRSNSSGFNAPSTHEFYSWSVAKRHACEWMRAVALKELVRPVLMSSTADVPSTKGLVLWCRQHGYTPLIPVPNGTYFCKLCGFSNCTCVDYHNFLKVSTMTSIIPFFEDHAVLTPDDHASFLCPVEVQEGEPILKWESKTISDEDTTWIMTVIAELGSDAESKWFSDESSHLCQHIIATACRLWLNTVLHQVTMDSGGNTASDVQRPILPFQIYKAITSLHCCQFLTNSGLLLDKY